MRTKPMLLGAVGMLTLQALLVVAFRAGGHPKLSACCDYENLVP